MTRSVAAATAISAVTVMTWLVIRVLGGGPAAPAATAPAATAPAATAPAARHSAARDGTEPGRAAARSAQCVKSGHSPPSHTPRPPQYSQAAEWPLAQFRAHKLWAHTEGAGITIAVVDTGIDDTQPDLRGVVVERCDLLPGRPGDLSKDSHGTAVAGLIAARGSATNPSQMAGLAPGASLIDVRVTAQEASVTAKQIVGGIRAAVSEEARVINISLRTPVKDKSLAHAVRQAVAQGCLVVASAGNAATPQYPADYPGVLRVAAIQAGGVPLTSLAAGQLAQGGSAVYAPGASLFSTAEISGRYAVSGGYVHGIGGTDYATAYVSAAAALLLSADQRLRPAHAGQWLVNTATPIHGVTGFGVLNPQAALRRVLREQGPSASPRPGASPFPPPLGPVNVLVLAAILLLSVMGTLAWRRRAGRPGKAVPHAPSIWDEP
jgi:subtilisin family serine protease